MGDRTRNPLLPRKGGQRAEDMNEMHTEMVRKYAEGNGEKGRMVPGLVAQRWNWGVALFVIAAGAVSVGVTQGYLKHDGTAGVAAIISSNLPNLPPAMAQYPIDIVVGTLCMFFGALLLCINYWSNWFLAVGAAAGDQWFHLLFDTLYRLTLAFTTCQWFGVTDWGQIISVLGCFQAMNFLYYLDYQVNADSLPGLFFYTEKTVVDQEAARETEMQDFDETVVAKVDSTKFTVKTLRPHPFLFNVIMLVFAWVPLFANMISTMIVQANTESVKATPGREGISIAFFLVAVSAELLELILTGVRYTSMGGRLRSISFWPPIKFVMHGAVLCFLILAHVGLAYELFR